MTSAHATRALVAALCVAGCEQEERALTPADLLDPESCKSCHPNHYREWASSMHAYAADDPVFLAMNRRGQEETDGGLGDFCVDCHAPMAVRQNAIDDYSDLEDVPQHLKGVTCYFCHAAVGVESDHNNGIVLAQDGVMRGGFGRGTAGDPLPVQPAAHRAEYSRLHDGLQTESSRLCGSCHDIVTPPPGNAPLERTFVEYQGSVQASGDSFLTCQGCHMNPHTWVAAEDRTREVPARQVHEHLWPGVDLALTSFPDRDLQRAAVECFLDGTAAVVDVWQDGPVFNVSLETLAAHNQPSGAAQDRRMWLELVAYAADGRIIHESGTIADDEPETVGEPDTQMFRDRIFDAEGNEVHMFWEAVRFESTTLAPARPDGTDHTTVVSYRFATDPERIVVRLRMRPMGYDVLQDLVDSGHLDPEVIREMPTFTFFTGEWAAHRPPGEAPFQRGARTSDCSYPCELPYGGVGCDDE